MPQKRLETGAEIERLFLWQDIVELFSTNSEWLGVYNSFNASSVAATMIALAESPEDDKSTLRMWAELSEGDALIDKASLQFIATRGHRDRVYSYGLTASNITQFSTLDTPLDREDMMALRARIADAVWDKRESQEWAEEMFYLGKRNSSL